MKKTFLLNSQISGVISQMGHTDTIVIGDIGLPIPKQIRRIDLAVKRGLPSFIDVLEAILSELAIEGITIAEEMKENNAELYNKIYSMFPGVTVNEIPHEEFKKKTESSRAIVRTGECMPYANVILHSAVVF
jgi:D-ribose pyranase